jgi:hypothetical protein
LGVGVKPRILEHPEENEKQANNKKQAANERAPRPWERHRDIGVILLREQHVSRTEAACGYSSSRKRPP